MRILLFIAVLLFGTESLACSCKEISLEEKVSSSDFIYLGKITESTLLNSSEILNQLELIELIKGSPDTFKLTSAPKSGMCSQLALVGTNYIIYGNYKKTPSLSLCGKSQVLDREFYRNYEKTLSDIKSTANKSLKQDK